MMKLSICIPTLNRGAFIGQTLESIVSQAEPGVEIIIVDGGSRDDTERIVRGYQERFPALRYEREVPELVTAPSAGGFDQDCMRTVELASGEYCWLMTDDDVLVPGAIRKVLAQLEDGHVLVVPNAEVRDAKLERLIEERRLKLYQDKTYGPAESDEVMVDVGGYLSFVAGVVIRRDFWLEREKEPYVGMGYIHMFVIFQAPLPGTCRVIAEPLISIRFGNAHWSSLWFRFRMIDWPDLVWSFSAYSPTARNRVCPRGLRGTLRLLSARAKGYYELEQYREWTSRVRLSLMNRLLARLVLAMPGKLLNGAALLTHATVIWEPTVHLDELRSSQFYAGPSIDGLAHRLSSLLRRNRARE
jgi:glycosyltransferase involved in cell wall biosynthesis